MKNRILVTYGTKAGSTKEVAEYIAATLRETDAAVDVRPVQLATDVTPYKAVVVGSAIRTGHILRPVVKWVKQYREELRDIPTAYFVVCMTMQEDTPENIETVRGYFKPLVELKEPVALGMFAGKMDHSKLEQPWRFLLRNVKDGAMADGDFRDWDDIRYWAQDIIGELVEMA